MLHTRLADKPFSVRVLKRRHWRSLTLPICLVGILSAGLGTASAQADNQLSAIACPLASLCVAADNAGDVVTSTDPTGGTRAWTTTKVYSPSAYAAWPVSMSCPSAELCAVANGNDLLSATNPTGGAGAWEVTTLDSNGLSGISCPSASLCVAVDPSGNVLVSTDPTGGVGAWTTTAIGGGQLDGISCPTTTLCVAVDAESNIITTTDPTGGTGAWALAHIENGKGVGFVGVTCPSTSLCVAAASNGYVVTATNPTGGATAWTTANVVDDDFEVGLSCPSTSLCVGLDRLGEEIYSTNPTGGASAWTVTTEIDGGNFPFPSGIACPNVNLCVATDHYGYYSAGSYESNLSLSAEPMGGTSTWSLIQGVDSGETGKESPQEETPPAEEHSQAGGNEHAGGSTTGPPGSCCASTARISSAQLKASLAQQLKPSGRAATIPALLKHGGLTVSFTALEAGTLELQWYELPSGAKAARTSKAKPVLIATGSVTFSGAGSKPLKLKLTAQGKKLLLRHAKRLPVEAKGAFRPGDHTAAASVTKVFDLQR
jgi:hypothetical protein